MHKPTLPRILPVAIAVGWMVATAYLTLSPKGGGPDLFPGQDKAEHFLAYALMGYLVSASINRMMPALSRRSTTLVAILWCGLYGFVLELVQIMVGRHFSLFDELANVVGAAAGGWMFYAGHVEKALRRVVKRPR